MSAINKIYPWRVTRASRYQKNGELSATYKAQTHEIHRIDYKTLQNVIPLKFVEFNKWEQRLVINKTHHATEDRLKLYVNKPVMSCRVNGDADTKTDVEITSEEFEFINNVSLETFVHKWEAKLVELGFNKFNEICKAAYVLHLPSGRFLFFCVGMDNGLKTLYVTSKFKHRDSYRGGNYISAEEAMKL
jgi:hypothetical protein